MWYKIQNEKIKVRIIAKPNAKKTVLLNVDEDGLHVAIHAKPHKGEANKELIVFLAKLFDVPKSQVELVSGEGSKYKQVIMPLTVGMQKFFADPMLLLNLHFR